MNSRAVGGDALIGGGDFFGGEDLAGGGKDLAGGGDIARGGDLAGGGDLATTLGGGDFLPNVEGGKGGNKGIGDLTTAECTLEEEATRTAKIAERDSILGDQVAT